MTDPLEEEPENYANRMEFRLGPSLKYPLAIHAYRGRISVRMVGCPWRCVEDRRVCDPVPPASVLSPLLNQCCLATLPKPFFDGIG